MSPARPGLTQRALARRALVTASAGLFCGAAAKPDSPAGKAPTAKPATILAATPIHRLDLPWWRARHEAKRAELRTARPDLLWLGDSITQNWESAGPEEWRNFRPVWDRFYAPRRAVNLGFKGDTTASLLWRLDNGELDGIAPRAAIMLIGANNLGRVHWSAEHTLLGIAANIAAFHKKLPEAKLLLLAVLPSIRNDWATQTTREINDGLAARYGKGTDRITYMDLGHLFRHNGAVDTNAFYDRLLTPPDPPLHPTAQTQARMAETIEPLLASWLGKPR